MKSGALLLCVLTAAMAIPGSARAAEPSPGRHLFSTLVADPGFTAAWAGLWDMTFVQTDCTTGDTLQTIAEQDTICTGNTLNPDPGVVTVTCDGTITDTNLTLTCTGSDELIPGCTINFTYTVTGSRSGDNLTGTATTNITYTGDQCFGIPDFCQTEYITGTRTGPAPAECFTPVLPSTWGRLKALYTD